MQNWIKHTSFIRQKLLPAVILTFCLGLLIGVNFFIYPQAKSVFSLHIIVQDQNICEQAPQLPAEQKSSSNNIPSIDEDFLQDHLFNSAFQENPMVIHVIQTSIDLQVVHYDLLSPPPDFFIYS